MPVCLKCYLEHHWFHGQASAVPQAGKFTSMRTASTMSCWRCCDARRNSPQTGAKKQRQEHCFVSGHVGSRYARSIRTAGKRRRIREGLVKKERRHGTFEGFAKGVSGDARHGGTGLSIFGSLRGFERGLCYRRREMYCTRRVVTVRSRFVRSKTVLTAK
jgi:hypothetical protein